MKINSRLAGHMNAYDSKSGFPIAYACFNKDLETRLDSTSGGVFSVLASYFILEKQATVFGAAFDENFSVKHVKIDSIEQLGLIRGSKYPQCNVCNSFDEVKQLLDKGRVVFFTGAPCHIVGLKNYLGKEYDTLFTMDFVCHGVGSDSIWRAYANEFSKSNRIKKIIFKAKTHGWKKWYFKVIFQNGDVWQRRGNMTLFMRSYLSYANIRPSCYECHFKGLNRSSDFTISDCWGIAELNKDINDNNGLSALLIQNDRAEQLFDAIKSNLKYIGYDAEELMAGNWTTFKSVEPNSVRLSFFKKAYENSPMDALKSYFKPSLKNWLGYYYKRLKGVEK